MSKLMDAINKNREAVEKRLGCPPYPGGRAGCSPDLPPGGAPGRQCFQPPRPPKGVRLTWADCIAEAMPRSERDVDESVGRRTWKARYPAIFFREDEMTEDYIETLAKEIAKVRGTALRTDIADAADVLTAIAATGCKVVAREPTAEMSVTGVWWKCLFDAAPAYPETAAAGE